LKKEVAVIAAGQTPFIRSCGMSIRELCFEAYKDAAKSINIDPKDVDASIIASAPEYDKQRTPAALVSEYLGFPPSPTFYLETVCSSGTTGIRVGYALIKSGLHDIVVMVGFQKMSELDSRTAAQVMGRGDDTIFSSPFGTTMPGGHALYAQAHMDAYGTTEEQLAKIRVKNSFYGSQNELANYKKRLDLEACLNADMVCTPLKKFDCCANCDVASAGIFGER